MKPRRNRAQLERAAARARSRREKALASFNLAVFHDNNAREPKAIPHYQRALRLGLPSTVRADALAWLASSLYKSGRPRRALSTIGRARRIARDAELLKFLYGLERRVRRSLAR